LTRLVFRLRYLPFRTCGSSGDALPPPKASCWMFKVKRLAEQSDMRVVTAFKRMLHLDRWEAEHGEVIGGGVRTGIPGPQDRSQRFAGPSGQPPSGWDSLPADPG